MKKTVATKDNELIITRSLNAPRRLLWQAWSDPEMITKWWGPRGFTSPYARNDFRVGGKYLNCMRSPEGQDYWSTGTYQEIIPMKKIVCTDSFADYQGKVVPGTHYGMDETFPDEMLITLTFSEEEGKTVLTLQHSGIHTLSIEDRRNMEIGWMESLDKLAQLVES